MIKWRSDELLYNKLNTVTDNKLQTLLGIENPLSYKQIDTVITDYPGL